MKRLSSYCNAANVVVLGAIVLDSRLDVRQTNEIKLRMNNMNLVSLYQWPTTNLELSAQETK